MLEPVWVTRIKPAQTSSFSTAGRIFGNTFEIFLDSLIYYGIHFEITSKSWWNREKPFRRSGNLSCMIPSAEFEKTANCCKTANLKTVHSHHSGKRKSKCKLQIAAKQNKKCLLVTIWRKKTNYKLQQKKWPYSPFREKKKHFANCSKKLFNHTIGEKKKQIA